MINLTCKICKREFKNYVSLVPHFSQTHKIRSKDYYDKFLKKNGEEKCNNPNCNNNTSFLDIRRGYSEYCSLKCVYLDPLTQFKIKQTCLKKYNVDNPSKYEKVKEKKEDTSLKNYGVRCSFEAEEVKEKKIVSYLKNFGVDNPSKSEKIKEKKAKTCLKNYNVDSPFKSEQIREKSEKTMIEKYGVKYATQLVRRPSIPQIVIFRNVKELCLDTELEYPFLNYTLDIAILSLKIDIEYDGFRYHQGRELHDKKRDEELKKRGWRIIRYKGIEGKDIVPTKDQILKDIQNLIQGGIV